MIWSRLFYLLVALSLLLSACVDNTHPEASSISNSNNQIGGAKQGVPLVLSPYVTSFVGAGTRFNGPSGITTDGANLFVADSDNHVIRKIELASGSVTTLAGSAGHMGYADGTGAAARFNKPAGITTDGSYLYVVEIENSTIRQIELATGIVTTLAGSPYQACWGDHPPGTPATFCGPTGITMVGTNLYVTDTGDSVIRKVDANTGFITTFAGQVASYGSADGSSTEARFTFPRGIVSDGINLFVADNGTIRKIEIATGNVTTLAGSAGLTGASDGTGTQARFNGPSGITTDGACLFVTDAGNSTIRKVVIATGIVTTLVGEAYFDGSSDGIGSDAQFNHPSGITTDGTNLFISDTSNHTIRKVVIATGLVTTISGSISSLGDADDTGSEARFNGPTGITTDGTNLFITDTAHHTIRKVVIATGVVTTFAGAPYYSSGDSDGFGPEAGFNRPSGITTDGSNLFIADTHNNTIRKIVIATRVVTTLAGSAGNWGLTDGIGNSARFNMPLGITTDGVNLFVTDSNNLTIRKVVISTGAVTTLAGNGNLDFVNGFYSPSGITTDGINLYVTDYSAIRKIEMSTGTVTILAGQTPILGSLDILGIIDGMGTIAKFNIPHGITTDGTNLFVTDTGNHTVRKVEIATGEVTTIAGAAGFSDSSDGKGSSARFWNPSAITSDGFSLFVVDTGNNTIRRIR